MPRKPRNYSPNTSCHIYLSANKVGNCFYDQQDYTHYLILLNRALISYQVALHAYALLDNHIQLLLTPTSTNGISKLMQSISSSYVRYYNKKYQRSGPLFKGRYKACVIEADKFLLPCMRYIEEQPRRSNKAINIAHYLWSSYRDNNHGGDKKSIRKTVIATVTLATDKTACKTGIAIQSLNLIKPHQQYLDLGTTDLRRQQQYQSLFNCPRKHGLDEFIRERLIYNFPIASHEFIDKLEQHFAIEFFKITPGRPKKRKRLRIPIFYC